MWHIRRRNGGIYHHIVSEQPCPKEMNEIIETLLESETDFRLCYNQYEYSGYSSDVELIRDEDLATMYVHHHVAFGHDGENHWKITLPGGCWWEDTVIYDSRYGKSCDIIARVVAEMKESSTQLLLPAPRKKTWIEEMTEAHERMRQIRQSTKSSYVEWLDDEIYL